MLQPRSAAGAPGASRPFQRLYNSKQFKKAVFYLKKAVFFCSCFFSNFITECPSPQARGTYYAADTERRRRTSAQRCRRAAPQARRSQQEEARGTSEARVTSAHPHGRVTDVLMRTAGRQRARCEQSEAAGDRYIRILLYLTVRIVKGDPPPP